MTEDLITQVFLASKNLHFISLQDKVRELVISEYCPFCPGRDPETGECPWIEPALNRILEDLSQWN